MGLAKWFKSLVLAPKYPCGVSLRKNNSLGELRDQGCVATMVLRTPRGVAHGKDSGFEFCGGTCWEV